MGISLNCEIKAQYNYKRIEEIKKRLAQSVGVEEVLKNIQGCAIRLERGHNQEGILVEMVEGSTGDIRGRIYADPSQFISNGQSYLWFEYFGTRRICRRRAYRNYKTLFRKWIYGVVYSSK